MASDWKTLDDQMRQFSPRLRDDLGMDALASNHLASTLVQECSSLPPQALTEFRQQDVVGLDSRLQELLAFQGFMDIARSIPSHPTIVRAQVITQNYVCFVYLGESCFRVLKKHAPAQSALRRSCQFLTDNPVRAFRNALAHANWRYNEDFSGLRYWARKGSDPDEKPTEFEVLQLELGFWQSLARCVAYVAILWANERSA